MVGLLILAEILVICVVQSFKIYSLPDFIDHLKYCDTNRTIFQCYRKAEQAAFECQHSIYMDVKYRKCKFQNDVKEASNSWWSVKEQWQRNMSSCLNDNEMLEPKKTEKGLTVFNIEFQDCLQESLSGIKTCHQLSLKCDKFKFCWEKVDVMTLARLADEAYARKSRLLNACINQIKR